MKYTDDVFDLLQTREKYMNRVDVLNKTKTIICLENTELATLKMVAEYFQVSHKTIESVVLNNQGELVSNGMTLLRGQELKDFKKSVGYKSNAASITFFTRKTILNVAMLLRDSEVAVQVRKHLLNMSENEEEIKKVVEEIDQEKLLAVDVIFAETEEERLIAMGKYREYKNKALLELEARAQVAEEKVEDLLKTDKTSTFREAKAILKVKERAFIKWLLHKEYIYRNTQDKLMPYHKYIEGDKPFFRVVFVTNKYQSKTYSQTVITLEGMNHFRQFKEEINNFN